MRRMRNNWGKILTVFALAAVLTGCGVNNSGSTDTEAGTRNTDSEMKQESGKGTGGNQLTMIPGYQNEGGEFAKGPNGETAVSADQIAMTDEQYKQIKEKGLKAAMLWAGSGEWYNAMTDGAKAEFAKMGIEVAAISEAQFDPSKQATDLETAMAVKPDIILTLPVDPVSGTRAYQPAVEAGVKIVFADNGVNNYKPGEQYVSIVTGDQYGMGRAAADLMAQSIDKKGKIGIIYYDVDYLVTNNRDNEFVRTIKEKYPDIKIAAMAGFSEESATGDVASAMLIQNPDLDGIYVSWDVAAEPVAAELRTSGKKNCRLVTMDLGGNNDLDMAQGGNVYGKVADMPYQIGGTMAKLAALSILGEEVPSYVVSDTVRMTRDNMVESWNASLHKDPDMTVMKALGK